MQEERAYWLAWSQISGVGPVLLKRIQKYYGNLGEAWKTPAENLAAIEGFGTKLIAKVKQAKKSIAPAQLLTEYSKKNPYFWTPADSEYPRLLLEIPSPPPVLHYRGAVKNEENRGIAPLIGIVGTRKPTEYGCRWTKKITKILTQHGFGIVSGLAAGIDAVSHRACLEANGRTIAVLGTGTDVVYPYSNRKLYEQINNCGLILSEYPAATKPDRGNFPARNRIIAGLCRAILVMEAPTKSGALITARFANDFGRDVYVLPGSLDNQQSLGCLQLLNRGANLIASPTDLLTMLDTIPQLEPISSSPTAEIPDLQPELAEVLRVITSSSIPLDLIVQETQLHSTTVAERLLQLELLGLVSQLPGMRYQRC